MARLWPARAVFAVKGSAWPSRRSPAAAVRPSRGLPPPVVPISPSLRFAAACFWPSSRALWPLALGLRGLAAEAAFGRPSRAAGSGTLPHWPRAAAPPVVGERGCARRPSARLRRRFGPALARLRHWPGWPSFRRVLWPSSRPLWPPPAGPRELESMLTENFAFTA